MCTSLLLQSAHGAVMNTGGALEHKAGAAQRQLLQTHASVSENRLLTGGGERWQHHCACYQRADFYCWDCKAQSAHRTREAQRLGETRRSEETRPCSYISQLVFHFSSSLDLFLKSKTNNNNKIQIRVKKRDYSEGSRAIWRWRRTIRRSGYEPQNSGRYCHCGFK